MARKETLEERRTNNQISLFDQLNMAIERNELSSKDIDFLINKMNRINEANKKREAIELRKKQQEEMERKRLEAIEQQKKHISEVTSMDLPLDWNNVFDTDTRTEGIHVESISDGLILSLSTLGKVDIEYISSITGENYKTVINALKGTIYQNPETWDECFYKGWESSSEYLSGNLRRKLLIATTANDTYGGYFADNISALKNNMPPHIATGDIYITLGSPWIPTDIIEEFIDNVIVNDYPRRVYHDLITGTWEISNKSDWSIRSTSTYGTKRINALHILEKTLNMKAIKVTDSISLPKSQEKKRELNQPETFLAIEKQQKLIKAFQKWVWKDEKRSERLKNIFEEYYGCTKIQVFDGSYLTFPNMDASINLYPYQKNAVARILFSPNTLLAHDVGSGKTYVMIAAGMELRRMGLSKKNMYVVPNNIIGQWKSIFSLMYPNSDVLCVEPKNFTPDKREETLIKIRDEEHDAIIIAYSCFEEIPLSKQYYEKHLLDQEQAIEEILSQKNKATSTLKKKRENLQKAMAELSNAMENMYNTVYFDELGINRLFVDEAHNYKNVPIETKTDHIHGINATGSKKCQDMLDKVKLIQKQNDGGGVVLATGTPITNSITDVYVMQQYLQSGELALLDLQSFDSWIGMFAERNTEFEIDIDTNKYRMVTRFTKFHNLPELTALLSQIADFHSVDGSNSIPITDGYTDVLISKTTELQDYLANISFRADMVRQGLVKRKEDNMLKITTDGRKAALDIRLVDNNAIYTPMSKVGRCVENTAKIYFDTMPNRLTQLIFCDTSTPKIGFNIYDEIKKGLIAYGVCEDEIAYIHDADTEKQRKKLFSQVRLGEIRILIGSTFKLGLGVNVQDKLIALHHLDVPWRPADMIQREGRILRQGNMNKKVKIFRYITEGSFDAYSWQLLETKARFICELLSGAMTERDSGDVDDTVLNYAEVKALAIGNPLIKERVEVSNELTKMLSIRKKDGEARMQMQNELSEIPNKQEHLKDLVTNCSLDIAFYEEYVATHPKPIDTDGKKKEAEQRKSLRDAIKNEILSFEVGVGEKKIIDYCGFEIFLPSNMVEQKPYLWIKKNGKYYVEMGESDIGYLTRIDNYLESMPEHLKKLQNNISELSKREAQIRIELDKDEHYTEKIEKLERKLKSIDKKLGVKEA